jgi:signal transduction histidine kinase
MSLQGKFRLLLAIFGISIAANVFVSVWCIQVYMRAATSRFELLMTAARSTEGLRAVLDDAAAALRGRLSRGEPLHRQWEDWTEQISATLAALPAEVETADQRARRERIAKLIEEFAERGGQADRLAAGGRSAEAAAMLEGPLEKGVLLPLRRELADYARASDADLTRTTADTADKQALVTLLLAVNACVAFLLAATGVHLVRNWLLKPLEGLTAAVERHARGDLGYRIPQPHAADELGTLAATVNRMAESLQQSQDRLVQQERLAAIGEVASSVAHNIRNPLASIRASVQEALPELAEGSPARGRAEEIIRTIDSLNRWLRELLMVSRPIDLRREPVAVDAVVERVLAVMRPEAQRRSVELSYTPAGASLRVLADVPRIEQALLAVVDNAVEASPAGKTVRIEAQAADGWVTLGILDEGPGLTTEVQARVATAYFSTKPGGTGIGAHLARRIAQAHGGDLEFSNRPAGGTMVLLRLPRAAESGRVEES